MISYCVLTSFARDVSWFVRELVSFVRELALFVRELVSFVRELALFVRDATSLERAAASALVLKATVEEVDSPSDWLTLMTRVWTPSGRDVASMVPVAVRPEEDDETVRGIAPPSTVATRELLSS
jgi:hypothetical protein